MPTDIRVLDPARDVTGAVTVLRAAHPYLVLSPAALAYQVGSAPVRQRFRAFVAVDGDRVAGLVRCGVDWETSVPGQGFANLSVHPDERGRGVGGALLAAAEEYLGEMGVTHVHAWVSADDASLRFAERHRYVRRRPASFLRLDLGVLPDLPEVPDGVELRPWTDFAADPRPLWSADADASRDEPGDVPVDGMDFDGWRLSCWDRPDVDRALSVAAVVDGTVAAFTLAQTDTPRYWSGMTGTRRAYRGRGLAQLVKLASLRRARDAGLTVAYTGNDAENAPMLHVNAAFGYRPYATQWRCVREFGAAG